MAKPNLALQCVALVISVLVPLHLCQQLLLVLQLPLQHTCRLQHHGSTLSKASGMQGLERAACTLTQAVVSARLVADLRCSVQRSCIRCSTLACVLLAEAILPSK